MGNIGYGIAFLLLPLIFLIMLPIEYPIWKEYKKQGYSVPNYFKFFWVRCILLTFDHDHYKKKDL